MVSVIAGIGNFTALVFMVCLVLGQRKANKRLQEEGTKALAMLIAAKAPVHANPPEVK